MTGRTQRGGDGVRAPWWLVALCLTTFSFYTDDHIISGILPELADGLGVHPAVAGQLVTVFSLTIAVAAPVAGVALARVHRRRLVLGALLVFTAANAAATLVEEFPALAALRVLAALAAAAATPSLFSVTADLAPEHRRGRYLSVLTVAITGSIALGLPLGAWLGTSLGWQATFGAMAVLGAVSWVLVALTLPDVAAGPVVSVSAQLRVLSSRPILLALVGGGVAVLGAVMMLTYLVPWTDALVGEGLGVRTTFFALFGVAAAVGVFGGGAAVDRIGANRTLVIGMLAYAALMVLLAAAWFVRPLSPAVFVPAVLLWGALGYCSAPAVQTRLHALAGPLTGQALAVNTSISYLGIALGGVLGGVVLTVGSAAWLPAVTALTTLLGLALLLVAFASPPVRASTDAGA